MSDIAADYELQAARLRRLLKAKKTFEPAMELALDLHAVTHTGVVSGSSSPTFCDHVLEGLADEDYSVMPTEKDETIAWHLWHIARIEDLVSEGGLLDRKGSVWLKDFWGSYTVTGLLLLPLTRHHMMHLPDSAAIKEFIKSGAVPFLKG